MNRSLVSYIRSLIFLILFAILSACTTQTTYISPSDGIPSANIKFITYISEFVSVTSYPPNVISESKANLIGVLQYEHLFDNEKDIEIKIPSGKPFVFSMKDDDREDFTSPDLVKRICKAKISFIPETGKSYLVKFSGIAENCNMNIFTVGANGKEEKLPADSFVRLPWCLDRELLDEQIYISSNPSLECTVKNEKQKY